MTALSALMSAEPSLHMGFSSRPVGDLATNRFTGPAEIRTTGSTLKDAPRDPAPPRPLAAPGLGTPSNAGKPPVTALSALMSAEPSLHMGFSSRPVGDLATNRFTGPAVKPLPVVR